MADDRESPREQLAPQAELAQARSELSELAKLKAKDVPPEQRPATLEKARAARERVTRLEAVVAKNEKSQSFVRGTMEAIRRAGGHKEYRKLQEEHRAEAERQRRERQEAVDRIGLEEAKLNRKRLEAERKILGPPTRWGHDVWRRRAIILGSSTIWVLLRDQGASGRLDPVLTTDSLSVLVWATGLIAESSERGDAEAWVNAQRPYPLHGFQGDGLRPGGNLKQELAHLRDCGLLLAEQRPDGRLYLAEGPLTTRIVEAFEKGEPAPTFKRAEEQPSHRPAEVYV